MPNPLSSWNGQIPTDVLLDSGILLIGSSPAVAFSAQEGGLKWDPGKTLRQIAFDGQHSDIAGLDRTVTWKPKLTCTILEIPLAAWSQLEPGSVLATVAGGPSGATQVQPKPAGVLYAAGDYIANARVAWQRTDGTYFQIRMPKALVGKWDVAGTDKAEGKWAIEIEPRLDMAVSGQLVSNCPFVGEYFTVTP
jgi:hypothetical protein